MSVYGLTRVLGAAFLMGFAAAAPVGPVNMMAIRRGLLGGPRHTLVCGVGAVTGDLMVFSLALWGGQYFILDLAGGRLRSVLALIGLVALLPIGVYFVAFALKNADATLQRARKHWIEEPIRGRLVDEAARAFMLTVLNPLAAVYWVGVATSWIPAAHSLLGPRSAGCGIAAAGAGMVLWFGGLVLLISFVPHRVSATLFRVVNLTLGVALIAFAVFCARSLMHFPGK